MRHAVGRDLKGKVPPVLYVAGIAIGFVSPAASLAVFTVVAVMWLGPDCRFERAIRPS